MVMRVGGQGLLVTGDLAKNKLVKWWFGPQKVGDLVISKSCGDGDFSKNKLVKWLFQPETVGGFGDFI